MRFLHFLWRVLFLCYVGAAHPVSADTEINGVSFVASQFKATSEHARPLVELNANYAAVMPFGFLHDTTSSEVRFDSDRQWYGETTAGAKQYIEVLQENGLKIMIKPQLWIWRGGYIGDLDMDTEESWLQLEASYHRYILAFAKLAEEMSAEIFCIGTELEVFVSTRPEFWTKLIEDVKTIYSGKLTYAANWDEYSRVPFWPQVDFIGVDAYFPISHEKTPTLAQARMGWKTWKQKLQSFSKSNDRPILFTEFGYRSIDHAGREPWNSDKSDVSANLQAQVNLTKALFEEFWTEPWFAGGFVWKWFPDHEKAGGADDNRFTPQNKPMEQVIQRQYSAKLSVE